MPLSFCECLWFGSGHVFGSFTELLCVKEWLEMTVRITFSHKNRSDHVSCKHKIFHWRSISRSQQTLGLMQWLTGSEFFFLSLITTLISASSQALLPPPTGFLSLILYPPAPICPGVWSCLYLSYSMALSPPDLYSNVDYPGNPFWNCTSACQHTLILSLLQTS